MQIVIDIPEEKYDRLMKQMQLDRNFSECKITLLSKGHKRLIEDNFEVGPVFDEEGYRVGYKYVTQEDLNNAPTIIEADYSVDSAIQTEMEDEIER